MDQLRPWQRAITALAVLKVLLALGLFGFGFAAEAEYFSRRDLLMAAHVIVYGCAAALLLTLGRGDVRAAVLGVAFLLTAAVFADSAIIPFTTLSPLFRAVQAVFGLQVDAFSAFFLWLFVHEFPRVASFGARYRVPRVAMMVSLVLGLLLFGINAARSLVVLVDPASPIGELLWPFARVNDHGLYWPLQYALTLPAFGVLIWKGRVAPVTDARRVSLLIGALALGTGPTVVWVLLSTLSPDFRRLVPLHVAGWVIYPALLSTPFSTAYAVLVHHALNVRLILRRAIRYAFARYSILSVAALPVLILVATLYRQRDQSVTSVMSGQNALLLATLATLALLASRGSRTVLERVDRRFFREQYDARRILGGLVERCRRAESRDALGEGLKEEIDRALHPTSVNVLFLEPRRGIFESLTGHVRSLPSSSEVVRHLRANNGPIEVDLEDQTGIAARLPSADRYWLADAGAQAVLALKNTERDPVGIVTLGEKRSELPYSGEDRQLLAVVAEAAALSLDHLNRDPESGSRRSTADIAYPADPASMCIACGRFGELDTNRCVACESPAIKAPLPRFLAGKFQVIERIGEGGMGVVYRGIDLALNRDVAIKTLPRVSARAAARLRREARAMAAITHPNLALIYGGESWNGMPILIVEFLPGGTLATRLARGPLPLPEVVELGIALADVTAALHAAGILHRDIKPSNIGYSADGTPKLLDFGLAELLSTADLTNQSRRDDDIRSRFAPGDIGVAGAQATVSVDGKAIGTPFYMSPEAIRGERPDPSFDLWSIAIVLLETLTHADDMRDLTAMATTGRLAMRKLADSRVFESDPRIVTFFESCLATHPGARPRSAGAIRDQLKAFRTPAPGTFAAGSIVHSA